MTGPVHPLLAPLQAIHRRIRDAVVAETERAAVESLAHVHADQEGDTIYAIDKVAEDVLVEAVDREIARVHGPVALVAEGLAGGRVLLPRGTDESARTCTATRSSGASRASTGRSSSWPKASPADASSCHEARLQLRRG